MRLYIPTSSLNADSILSCECVAPARACRYRNFGYSHFETLEELHSFDNYTLAFSKIPMFDIYDPTRENYPMVVEVEINDVEKVNLRKLDVIDDTEIYATANPILITPTNSRLLFFKREHLDYTYHSCSDSAKCKLFEYFKKRMGGIKREDIGVPLSLIKGLRLPDLNSTYSENDYDRVKGFVWGYGLGAFLSMSPEVANLLRIQKRIYDIISSTKNEGYIPQQLRTELETLDREYSKFDPVQRLAKIRWNEFLTQIASEIPVLNSDNVAETINSILVRLKVEPEAKNKFLADNRISLRKPLSSYPLGISLGYEQYSADLDLHTKSAIYHARQERIHDGIFDVLDIDTVSYKNGTLSVSDENSNLFNKILFRIIWDNLIPSLEEIRVNRKDVAINVVKTLKAIVEEAGNQWQGSELQAYYDRMRKNISKYEPFVLTDIDNPVFQSVAAFVLKGEDFESLKSYLETNAVANYRYALALWGAMIGYVSIPRALIQDLLNYTDIAKLYNLSERVLDKIETELYYESVPSPHYPSGNHNKPIPSTPSDYDDKTATGSISFRQKVLQFFERTIIKSQRKERRELLRQGLELAFKEFGDDTNPIKFVSLLNDFTDYGWKPTQQPWKLLRDYIAPNYEAKISRRTSSKEGQVVREIPSCQTQLQFGEDKEIPQCQTGGSITVLGQIWKGVKEFVSGNKEEDVTHHSVRIEFCGKNIKKIRHIIAKINPGLDDFALSQIENDLTWIFDPKYSADKSESDLLNLFKSTLISGKNEKFSKKGKPMDWKNKAYRPLNIENTIDYLRKLSGN